MDDIEDPTLVQPKCRGCGLHIRSSSFEVQTPHYRHEIPTQNGVVVSGMSGVTTPGPFIQLNSDDGWLHDDPRGGGPQIFDRKNHLIAPQEFGPHHTHAADYERQMRNWQMDQLERKNHLGQQFKQ